MTCIYCERTDGPEDGPYKPCQNPVEPCPYPSPRTAVEVTCPHGVAVVPRGVQTWPEVIAPACPSCAARTDQELSAEFLTNVLAQREVGRWCMGVWFPAQEVLP